MSTINYEIVRLKRELADIIAWIEKGVDGVTITLNP